MSFVMDCPQLLSNDSGSETAGTKTTWSTKPKV
jgi:hypothetical protein